MAGRLCEFESHLGHFLKSVNNRKRYSPTLVFLCLPTSSYLVSAGNVRPLPTKNVNAGRLIFEEISQVEEGV